MGILLLATGLLCVGGGASNWGAFMATRQAEFVAAALGRTWTRVFYVAIGVGSVALGMFLLAAGVDWNGR